MHPVLVGLLVVSAGLTVAGSVRRSWAFFMVAALPALGASVFGGFSVGRLLVLIPCLHLASAVALRWRTGYAGATALIVGGVLVWVVGAGFLPVPSGYWFIAVIPLGVLAAVAALILGDPVFRNGTASR